MKEFQVLNCSSKSKRMRYVHIIAILVVVITVQSNSDQHHGRISNYLKNLFDKSDRPTP